MSYFCIVKRNICLFKSFFVCLMTLLTHVGSVSAQQPLSAVSDSSLDSIGISLLTCQPHDEVYSLYGHTSIRVQDFRNGTDVAVNFGVFDSSADYFVWRFVFGQTDYMMAVYDFSHFIEEYRHYGSGVYQQRINMDCEEKRVFLQALYENSRPENVVYRYNFLYNNCTTKARDIILESINGNVVYESTWLQKDDLSIRDLLHFKTKDYPWERVGVDLLVGVKADDVASHSERQFLPEVLMNDFDSATVVRPDGSRKALVDSAMWVLLPGTPYHAEGGWWCPLKPRQMAVLFFCAILSLCLYELLLLKRTLLWVDYCVVLIYGLAGVILGAMLFSAHPTVNQNFQIFLLNPLYLFITLPVLHIKWRWHFMLIMLLLFFAGNAIQSYADGMNIMALALLLIVANNMYLGRSANGLRKK